jgi:hypothetical protein
MMTGRQNLIAQSPHEPAAVVVDTDSDPLRAGQIEQGLGGQEERIGSTGDEAQLCGGRGWCVRGRNPRDSPTSQPESALQEIRATAQRARVVLPDRRAQRAGRAGGGRHAAARDRVARDLQLALGTGGAAHKRDEGGRQGPPRPTGVLIKSSLGLHAASP